MLTLLLTLTFVQAVFSLSSKYLIWPPAQDITVSGPPLSLSESFSVIFDAQAHPKAVESTRLMKAIDRFTNRLQKRASSASGSFSSSPSSSSSPLLKGVSLLIQTDNLKLGGETDYSYSLTTHASNPRYINATSSSIFGAIYALESLSQLIKPSSGSNGLSLIHELISITDSPDFAWRGLMLDAGRRFFPLSSILNTLDTMLAAKLNVLHLHASDECRFGVESKLFPNLTDALSGVLGGFYTQVDIKLMIEEAGSRGIRVVPEFDVPGHSRGFRPIKSAGVLFCDPGETQSQLYGDPANSTLSVLQSVLGEMATLFEDEVFHIGADETGVVGPCTTESTFELERHVLNYLEGPLVNKTVAGWEELLFDAGAATNRTLIYAWSRDTPSDVINDGRKCVDSQSSHFYMTEPGGVYPQGWESFYYDISTGLTPAQLPMLLGGEMSMWTDTYCYIEQCGAFNGPKPVGSALFPPEMDLPWSQSVAGMIWPRGYVGAAAFWNYDPSVSSQDPDFVNGIWALNDLVISNGGLACPSQCECDQLSACGTPYIPPPPPPLGTVTVSPCVSGSMNQTWTLDPNTNYLISGTTISGSPLCVSDPGDNVYPLIVVFCNSTLSSKFNWDSTTRPAHIISTASGDCIDTRASDGACGTYECGSGSGLNQTNQNWWGPTTSGVQGQLVSSDGKGCMTVVME
jgi:hexosaminidase